MILDDQSTKMLSERLICSDQATEWQHCEIYLFEVILVLVINTVPLMAQQSYLQWLYLQGSGQVFQLVEHIKVFKQERRQLAINGANKKAKNEPKSSIDYQPDKWEWLRYTKSLLLQCTRPLFLQCALSLWGSLFWRQTLSLEDLLLLIQKHTKSTGSLKTIMKLQANWPLNSPQQLNGLTFLHRDRACSELFYY